MAAIERADLREELNRVKEGLKWEFNSAESDLSEASLVPEPIFLGLAEIWTICRTALNGVKRNPVEPPVIFKQLLLLTAP